jgi:hypothetical protein
MTNLVGGPSLDVTQDDDLPLSLRQGIDRLANIHTCFLRKEAIFWNVFPTTGERRPAASPPRMMSWEKLFSILGRFGVLGSEIRQ